MSDATQTKLRWLRLRRTLNQRFALDRWYPHFLIAAVMAPLGLLLLGDVVEQELGVRLSLVDLTDIADRASDLHHRPILEFAVGLSMIAMAIGVALRSRLAWLWSTAAVAVALALRLPPEFTDVPLGLYLAGVLALLLIHRRSFSRQSFVTSSVFAIVILISFLFWATMGTLRLGEQFEPPVRDVATAVYLVIVTFSSVGFGDIVARGPEARLFVVAKIAIGILVGATALGAILLPLIGGRLREIMGGRAQVDRNNHYVIVGKSPLARNVTQELEKRKQGVTIVLEIAPDEDFYHQRDVVIGDPTDLSVLRTAGAEQAKGVLALTTDDATNGFVVLGVNELDSTITTVVALNDPNNQFRLKRTQPSLMLSLQALGGELLAMALTGERVDMGMLSKVLQIHESEPETDA